MRHWKRLIPFVILISLVWAGIGSAGNSPLVVWNTSAVESDPGTVLLAKRFEETHPGVKVEITGIPYQAKLNKTLTDFFAGAKYTTFDIDEVTDMWVNQLIESGWIEPLDDLIGLKTLAKYPADFMKALKGKDGRIYALPHYINQPTFFYNTKLLKNAGFDRPPATWEELVEYSRKLTNRDVYGMAVPTYQQDDTLYYLLTYFYQAGARMFDENGKFALNSPEGIKAVGLLAKLYQERLMPPGITNYDCFELGTLFRQEKIAMMANWAFEINSNLTKPDSLVKDHFGVAPFPAGPAGSKIAAAPWLYVLSKRARNKAEAVEFLKAWTNPAELAEYVKTEPGKIVGLPEVYQNEEVFAKVPFSSVILENVSNFVLEVGPKKSEIGLALIKEVNKALVGTKSPAEALKAAEEEAARIAARR